MSDRRSTQKPNRTVCAFTLGWFALVVILWLFGFKGDTTKQLLAITAMAYLACWAPFFAGSLHCRRQKAMRFVVVTVSLLMALSALELSAKIGVIDFRHVFEKQMQPWENTKNLLDSKLVHVHRPHFQEKGQISGGDLSRGWAGAPPLTVRPYDVRYDRNGFRNEIDYDRVDCVVIGDSFVEAGNVSSDELLTHHIARELGSSVANLGQAYYGPQQEFKVLERVGVPLRPSICIWVFFEGNDLKDVWRYREIISDWPQSVANYSSWKERSFTKNGLIWLSAKLNSPPHSTQTDLSGLFSASHGEQRIWFGYVGREMSARDVEAMEITVATISKAHTLCKQRGIQLVVAFAPTKYRVYADRCSFEESSPIRDWVVSTFPEQLSESIRMKSSEIGFLDLTDSLREAAMSGRVVYYPDDTHWSPEGHAIVGRAISDFVRAQYDDLLIKRRLIRRLSFLANRDRPVF